MLSTNCENKRKARAKIAVGNLRFISMRNPEHQQGALIDLQILRALDPQDAFVATSDTKFQFHFTRLFPANAGPKLFYFQAPSF
jgi:hypothetical protein